MSATAEQADKTVPAADASLGIRLFGALGLTWEGQPLPSPRLAVARSLLAYLVLHRGRLLSRDLLAGTFWPDRPDAEARKALSHALWQVRRGLGPAAGRLVVERDGVSFTLLPQDWLDVEAFLSSLHRFRQRALHTSQPPDVALATCLDDLNTAVALYRADLLEDCYDDWILPVRERLREDYLGALEQLVTLYKRWGDDEQAMAHVRRLVAADPLRETAHRELMRLYHTLGRHRAALEQYAVLRKLLAEELGVEPDAATTALYRQIQASQQEDGPVHLPAPVPVPALVRLGQIPLVGRSAERAVLLEALQAAGRGHGGLVLVEGPAGVGKTRLVEEHVADARWRGFQVGIGRADPLAASMPYRLLHDALAPLLTPLRVAQLAELVGLPWLSAIAPLFPSVPACWAGLPTLAPLGPQQEQERLREGLLRCVAGLAAIDPLLLVLDDVHWADTATLSALTHLAHHLGDHRLLLVLACRSAEGRERAEVWEGLAALDRATSLLHLRLSPFERAEAVTLVQRALGTGRSDARLSAFAQSLYEATGGNGFMMVEMLKLLLARGDLAPLPGGGWRFPSAEVTLPVPGSVRELIRGRLALLDPTSRRLLELAAAMGQQIDFAVLVRAAALPSSELTAHLGRLCQGGFLVGTATGYRFEHELVREYIHSAGGRQKRRLLHRGIGDVLETLDPGRVEMLAYHFGQAGVEDKALAYTLRAGERAEAVHDYGAALSYYRQALAFVGENTSVRWEVLARQEKALDVLSRREAQREVLAGMWRLSGALGPAHQARTRFRQGLCEVRAGETSSALALLEEAAGLARACGEHVLLGHCLVNIARAWWRVGKVAPCRAAVEEARDLFRRTGNLRGELQVWNMLGNLHLGLTGDYSQALRCFEEDRRVAQALGDRYAEASAHGNVGIAYTLLGCHERSQEALSSALDVMVRVGDRHWQGIILVWQATNLYEMGESVRARAVAEEALQVCREASDPNFEIAALDLLGLIALDEEDPASACAHFEQAVQVARAHQQTMDAALSQSHLALACLRAGRPAEADRLSQEAIAALEGLGEQVSHLKDAYFERYQIVAATEGFARARPCLERAYQALQGMADNVADPDLRRSFLRNVRANAAIMAACGPDGLPPAHAAQMVRLPARSAPTGRPLRDDEFVHVTWTPAQAGDEDIPGKAQRRQHRLRRLLEEATAQGAAPTVDDLASALGVDPRTIKRDLAALRAAGYALPTRGRRSPGR